MDLLNREVLRRCKLDLVWQFGKVGARGYERKSRR
jgi:hypothetical protein